MSDNGPIRDLLHRHGGKSAIGLLTTVLLLQNAGVIPSAENAVKGSATDAARVEHRAIAKEVHDLKDVQREILQEQRATRGTTAQGFRILCLQGAKTETQRDRCLDIQ